LAADLGLVSQDRISLFAVRRQRRERAVERLHWRLPHYHANAALNSQKATEFVSTELVWRFNWFGR